MCYLRLVECIMRSFLLYQTISIQDIIIIFIFTEMSDTTSLMYQPFSGYQYCFTKIGDEKKIHSPNHTHNISSQIQVIKLK